MYLGLNLIDEMLFFSKPLVF